MTASKHSPASQLFAFFSLFTLLLFLLLTLVPTLPPHIAPRGAKKEEAFGGVILKSERPSGALFTNSGPPFFTVESKIEVLSPLGTSFHWLRTSLFHCSVQNRGPESARDLFSLTQDLTFFNYWHRNRGPEFTHAFFSTLNGTKEANTSLMPFLDSRLQIPQWKEIVHYDSQEEVALPSCEKLVKNV